MKTISLTNSDEVAMVDDLDFTDVNRFSWARDLKGYVYRNLPRSGGKAIKQFLHQYLLGVRSGFEVDHKDLDKKNNQRENLRQATRSQNCANGRKRPGTSSRFKGVCWHKARGKWIADIRIKGQHIHLGLFLIEEDAGLAYDVAASEHFGEFARLNFPQRDAL